jgi:hypothetical protein
VTAPPAAATQTCQASLRASSQILQQDGEGEDQDRRVAERGGEIVALAPEPDAERGGDDRAAEHGDRDRVGADPGAKPGDRSARAFGCGLVCEGLAVAA